MDGETAQERVVLCESIERLQHPLMAGEAEIVDRAVEKRRREFVAGRTLARRAIGGLGFAPVPILRRGRAPVWPEGVVGSISHCDTHCAVAVGSVARVRSVGIDLEVIGRVSDALWKYTFVADERACLAAAPVAERDRLATLMFSAKEAFFKMQYPLTGMMLDFTDADVTALADGAFQLSLRTLLPTIPHVIEGRSAQPVPGIVLCQVWLGRASSGK